MSVGGLHAVAAGSALFTLYAVRDILQSVAGGRCDIAVLLRAHKIVGKPSEDRK